jgi:hypothetical protein
VARLLSHAELFEPATGIESEHGVQAIAPFVRHFFPDVPIVAVVAAIDSPPETWESAAEALYSVITDRTLIVQSTDFSHYLPLWDAVRRDQESLGLIAAADPESVAGMLQPGHLDSRAAQYLQTALQSRVVGAGPVVIANRNSAEYGSRSEVTTSYVVAVFLRDAGDGAVLRYDDQSRVFLGGDTLLGRFMNPVLRNERAVETIAEAVVGVTGGDRLILNLEGVLLDGPVLGVGPGAHIMSTRTTLPLFRRLNVVAAGVANNHSDDLGADGLRETLVNLSSNGILPLQDEQVADLGGLRVVPVNLHRTSRLATDRAAALAEVGRICELSAEPPLIAFVHWGKEYTHSATSLERDLAVRAHECGVPLVVGAHSHQASRRVEALAGGAVQFGLFARQPGVRSAGRSQFRFIAGNTGVRAGHRCDQAGPASEPLRDWSREDRAPAGGGARWNPRDGPHRDNDRARLAGFAVRSRPAREVRRRGTRFGC